MKRALTVLIAGIGILAAGSVAAAEHKTPVAPKEYLAMNNPLKSSKDVIETGAKVYEKKCKKCHGEKGDGKGSASADLELKPVSFSTPGFLKGRADGQLFYIIEKGSPDTDMVDFGPGSSANLSKDELWSVIAYMRKSFTK